MPESNQIRRKRMRFSSSSASEILMTKKTLNQRDRPGRIAASASRFGVHHSPSLSGKIDSRAVRTFPRVSIKDLRLRRVFSPRDWDYNVKGENRTKEQDAEYPHDFAKQGTRNDAQAQTTPPDPEGICEDINPPAVKKRATTLCSKSVLHPCPRAKIFNNTVSFSYKRLLPYLMQAAQDGTSSGQCSKLEKSFGQTQPNINSSCNKETTNASAEDPKEEVAELMSGKSQLPEFKPVLQTLDRVLEKQSAGSLCGNTIPLKTLLASSPNKKSVCSRRKLFKTPGSVNYRRMLPYLRDIQQDNPCVPETVDHQNKTEENGVPSMEKTPTNVATESDSCSNENEEPLPCERVSLSPEPYDPEKEQETQVKHVIPDTEKNLGTPGDVEVPLSSPLVDSTEAATSALNNTFVDNVVSEENMYGVEETEANQRGEQVKADSLNLTAELIDPCDAVLGTPPSISPSKGILKRSIRGCRGICSCLNCSSFRLNAERAFEFSRNQLQDTEVMVLDLVGEISHLRDMLEKYESADPNDSYKNQAGKAAKRASEAAELAKSRLHQMNDELQVHCRIPNEQRARVKFAHYVHEKTILKASQLNKSIPTTP